MTNEQGRPLTPEEARAVDLPSWVHPIKRMGALAQLATAYPEASQMAMGPLVVNRTQLVNLAETYANRQGNWEQLQAGQQGEQR
jgi:hypothetical protein